MNISRIEHEEHGIAMKFYAVNPNILSDETLKDNKLTEQISKEIKAALDARSGNYRGS